MSRCANMTAAAATALTAATSSFRFSISRCVILFQQTAQHQFYQFLPTPPFPDQHGILRRNDNYNNDIIKIIAIGTFGLLAVTKLTRVCRHSSDLSSSENTVPAAKRTNQSTQITNPGAWRRTSVLLCANLVLQHRHGQLSA